MDAKTEVSLDNIISERNVLQQKLLISLEHVEELNDDALNQQHILRIKDLFSQITDKTVASHSCLKMNNWLKKLKLKLNLS